MSLGMPFTAQADPRSSDYPNRNDRNERQYYTNQYGDLDTEDRKHRSNRYKGNRNVQAHSSYSRQDPDFRHDFRASDEQLRRDVLNELEEGTDRVKVKARNGVVTLSGMVENREAMLSTVDAAYEAGARKVKNHWKYSAMKIGHGRT